MKTFAYKEVSGDFEIHARLTGFDSTSYDSDYFGIMATDNLDLYNANFFEERHFSNNNNILMVTHTEGQEKSTTSSWAGDMNGKNVPIDFVIRRTGNVIEYWFSLDEGKTYQQTSKPKVTLNADDVMYVGFCMTAQKEITNTAHVEDVHQNFPKVLFVTDIKYISHLFEAVNMYLEPRQEINITRKRLLRL